MALRQSELLLAGNEGSRRNIVIERAQNNFSAYSIDLPGCVATGATPEETERNMYEAIELHLHGMREDNLPIPTSSAIAEYVMVK